METIKFNVKDKSVDDFFMKYRVKTDNGNNISYRGVNDGGYNYMKDTLYIDKSCDLKVGDQVEFELGDRAQFSQTELVNSYIYEAVEYDDMNIKLELKDFKVEIKQKNQ